MKKCRKCRTTNTSNVYRCINCGSSIFERKTTGIILFIFAVYSLFNYFTFAFFSWKTQLELTDGDSSTIIFFYLFQMTLAIISFLFSYRLWPSGYNWLFRMLGKEIPEDQSATFQSREYEKTMTPVPVHQKVQTTKQCSECKAMNPEIAKYCYSCSKPFSKVQTVKETIAPPTLEKQETTEKCLNCGVKKMTSEQKFCFNCGYEISKEN
jgi:hypothetical protein